MDARDLAGSAYFRVGRAEEGAGRSVNVVEAPPRQHGLTQPGRRIPHSAGRSVGRGARRRTFPQEAPSRARTRPGVG